MNRLLKYIASSTLFLVLWLGCDVNTTAEAVPFVRVERISDTEIKVHSFVRPSDWQGEWGTGIIQVYREGAINGGHFWVSELSRTKIPIKGGYVSQIIELNLGLEIISEEGFNVLGPERRICAQRRQDGVIPFWERLCVNYIHK